MGKKLVKIMNTSFRDGFQSVFGARVFTKDFLPAVKASVEAGLDHFEAGGGARFQSLFFYCNENAFDMMDSFRETVGKDIDLQTLARGINVVGLDSQSRDMIELHARLFKKHGITTIRNFDALNDVNNLIYSGQCIVKAGLKHEVVVTMMGLSPEWHGNSHTPEFYVGVLKGILESKIPFDSVCFKDASGTSEPSKVYNTIKMARQILPKETKIVFHTHETAGTSILCYKAALEAGADQLDLAMAPVSGGTCQPDIITMWHALRGTDFDLGIDIDKMRHAEEVFKDCMKDYFMPPESRSVEPLIPFSPMPGGALTANTQMMRDNNILDKYEDVVKAMGEVVERGGFGTSVTPVSQFYFQQAFNNVMFGKWEKIAEGYGKMVLGYFGKTPIEPDKEIVALASKQLNLEPTTKSPLDINDEDPNKGIPHAKKMLKDAGLEETEENIFIAGTCKDKGIQFLKGNATIGVRKKSKEKKKEETNAYTVTVNENKYSVVLESENKATVNGKSYNINVATGASVATQPTVTKTKGETEDSVIIKSPLPGSVVKIKVNVGDNISKGDTLVVLEAMKMETEVKSTTEGTVSKVSVNVSDQVTAGQELIGIN